MEPSQRGPCHAHIYFDPQTRERALALRGELMELTAPGSNPPILFVGRMVDGPIGPHPNAQFEAHFLAADWSAVVALISATGLRALVHPLTDNDLADHTSLASWLGEPLDLDLSVLDPPGINQGMPRFGKTDC